MSEAYGTAMEQSVNCVIISGKRSGVERIAACLVRADTRADVNTVVKKLLDVRKCSFHPMDRAVEETELEYVGITTIGLPAPSRLRVDTQCVEVEVESSYLTV